MGLDVGMLSSYVTTVILADGSPAQVRSVRPDDREQLLALHQSASDLSLYRRFFSLNRTQAAKYAEQVCTPADGTWSLVAIAHERVVGLATAARTAPATAEVAVIVDEQLHTVGIGTLLVEHLAAWCAHDGVERFTADVLVDNVGMIRVFHDAGFEYVEETRNGVISLSLQLYQTPTFLSAAATRQRRAEARSIARILEPASVAVVGVSGHEGGIGRAVLDNVVGSGYQGTVHAVGRHLSPTATPQPGLTPGRGVHQWREVADLPEAVDLAVVAVPVTGVRKAVTSLAERGARSCVVLTAGLGEAGDSGARLQDDLAAVAQEHGMRLVGPNCLGVLSHLRHTALDATFAASRPGPGRLAIASQSGGVGVALLEAARDRGTGVACFVSTGNKADLSTNDLLMAWTDDPAVGAAAVYLESFKDPQRFARVASTFSMHKPLLAVFGGRSESGRRAGSSHTAASATPGRALAALFQAAGVIEVTGLPDLVDTSRLLCEQPLPGGGRVGIIANAGGVGILASDAAQEAGLRVPELPEDVRASLRALGDGVAGITNPVDLGAAASPTVFADAVRTAIDCADIDALLVVVVATAVTDIAQISDAVRNAVSKSNDPERSKPVLAVLIGGSDRVDDGGVLTTFDSVDGAIRALAHAVEYVDWRAGRATAPDPRLTVPLPSTRPGPGDSGEPPAATQWLAHEEAGALLTDWGIPVAAGAVVTSALAAVRQADTLGYPVVVKTAVPGIVHKTDQRLVMTAIPTARDVRRAVHDLQAVTGPGTPVLVQHSEPGVEIALGMVQDARFGPLVMVASGGVSVELWSDQVFLMPPLDAIEVRAALSRLRTWPLLTGFRGSAPADIDALVALVVRLGDLALACPEVREIDLNPVMVTEDGACCVDAKIRSLEA